MGQVDAAHLGAGGACLVQHAYELVGVAFGKAIDEVRFGANRPLAASLGRFDGGDDLRGAPCRISRLDYLTGTFGMHNHADIPVRLSDCGNVLCAEELVNVAVAFPQDKRRPLDIGSGQAAVGQVGVVNTTPIGAIAHGDRGIPAEVLVGYAEYLSRSGAALGDGAQRPFEDVSHIARCAACPARPCG